MELAKLVTVTVLFFIAVILLTSGRALSADDPRRARQRAVLADEAEELRRIDAQEARRNAASASPSRGVPKRNFERLCIIRPVMADREIEACRISYQRKDI